MTLFDKAGTFSGCGQAVVWDCIYLLRMDLQSLVMNLPAFLPDLFSHAHYMGEGVLGDGGALCERPRKLNPGPKRKHLFYEPHMEADARAERGIHKLFVGFCTAPSCLHRIHSREQVESPEQTYMGQR